MKTGVFFHTFSVRCGYCGGVRALRAKNWKTAREEAAAAGWSKTRARGMQCPACAISASNAASMSALSQALQIQAAYADLIRQQCAARHCDTDAVLMSRPALRATASPEWMLASEIRRAAIGRLVVKLPKIPLAQIAEAIGVTRASVCEIAGGQRSTKLRRAA
jgi:hypothetical protein